jgi:alkylhydroperoxidase/carboxymuconolactone decarboxylase family protein YurZ
VVIRVRNVVIKVVTTLAGGYGCRRLERKSQYHLDRSIEEGATKQELYEAMNIALIVGGSIVIPHLRYAFECMEELMDERA